MADDPPIPPRDDRVLRELALLRLTLWPEINWDQTALASNGRGWHPADGIREARLLASKVQATLARLLSPNEQVRFLSSATQRKVWEIPNPLAEIFGSDTVLVATNVRILLIDNEPFTGLKRTYWTIYYSEIERISWWCFAPALRLRDGSRLVLGLQSDGLRLRHLRTLIERAREEYRRGRFAPRASQSRENLCGHCFQVVPAGSFRCDKCSTRFWRPGELARRSLAFPPWGSFAAGNRTEAVIELASYLAIWWGVLHALIARILPVIKPRDALTIAVIFSAVLTAVSIIHVLAAIHTWLRARRGMVIRYEPEPSAESPGLKGSAE